MLGFRHKHGGRGMRGRGCILGAGTSMGEAEAIWQEQVVGADTGWGGRGGKKWESGLSSLLLLSL